MNSKKNVNYWLINLQEMLIMQHGNVKKESLFKGTALQRRNICKPHRIIEK